MRTCVRMTSQGHPYARFRRAIRQGNPTLATAAAAELPRMALADALGLVLCYRRAGDVRYERAALRFCLRLCHEQPALGLAGAASALEALAAIGRGEQAGVEALAALLGKLGAERLVVVLDEWAETAG